MSENLVTDKEASNLQEKMSEMEGKLKKTEDHMKEQTNKNVGGKNPDDKLGVARKNESKKTQEEAKNTLERITGIEGHRKRKGNSITPAESNRQSDGKLLTALIRFADGTPVSTKKNGSKVEEVAYSSPPRVAFNGHNLNKARETEPKEGKHEQLQSSSLPEDSVVPLSPSCVMSKANIRGVILKIEQAWDMGITENMKKKSATASHAFVNAQLECSCVYKTG